MICAIKFARLKLENFLHDLNHPGAKGNSRGGATDELFGPLLAKYDISLPRTDRHTMVGAGEDQQVCRFCGQTRADGATLGKQAHVIPTALGNDLQRASSSTVVHSRSRKKPIAKEETRETRS